MDVTFPKFLSKFFWVTLVLFSFSFLIGIFLFSPRPRNVNSTRVEKCLRAFIEHKKTGDAEFLRKNLEEISIAPSKFEKIIDRFLHYRLRQSSLNQAMKLLEAFKSGYNIVASDVVSKSDEENTGFALDAEILTVFKEKPELVQEAFGG